MREHQKIDYVEFPATDIEATKAFFTELFGWTFKDFGLEYCAFENEGLNGGFYKSDKRAATATGSALIVFYSTNLEQTLANVESAGGKIAKAVFSFPGGRRFHFTGPSGNEYAVWSDTGL